MTAHDTASAGLGVATHTTSTRRPPRGRLLRKYILLFVAVVITALVASGALQVLFSYGEQIASLERLQQEQAGSTAQRIEQYVKDIRGQIGWTTQLQITPETLRQRRFDLGRLLTRVPAITELAELDANGLEQIRVSRIAMDVVESGLDRSHEEAFAAAQTKGIYFGPIYYRRESEPYMTIAQAGTIRSFGVTLADVNLKFIWDFVDQIDLGKTGYAYVVDAQGHLIAHSDLSLVLRNLDFSSLPQFAAAVAGQPLDRVRSYLARRRAGGRGQAQVPRAWLAGVRRTAHRRGTFPDLRVIDPQPSASFCSVWRWLLLRASFSPDEWSGQFGSCKPAPRLLVAATSPKESRSTLATNWRRSPMPSTRWPHNFRSRARAWKGVSPSAPPT